MGRMIEVRGLSRTFKTKDAVIEAVRGVDFQVAAGEIVAFLGPNGAGKTTTQRMLATLLTATAGDATVAGCDLRRDPVGVRRRIGYVQQGGATNGMSSPMEELIVQGRLYGMSKTDATVRGRQLCRELDLEGFADRRAQTLSGGQRRRLDIAMGLIHAPKLVFLDEPSTGLDPQSRANLWAHIRGLRDRQGATVFLTTHYLDEADALCDRILIIDHGSIVAAGTPEELKRRVSGDVITFEIARTTGEAATDAQTVRALLAAHPSVREAAVEGGEGGAGG